MMLLHVALVVLVSEAWSLDRGYNQTSEKFNASSPDPRVSVVLNSSFKQGQDANLTCGDKTWTKDKMMYIIWRMTFKHKTCDITFHIDGRNENNCSDYKSLRNTSEAQPILHIPRFSLSDVGVYTCESVYSGGADSFIHNVNITAPPHVSSWINWRGDKKVAVCRAEGGNPAANISWTFNNNSTEEIVLKSDGLITVQKSVELGTHEGPENISCTVTHPYWDEPQVIVPKLKSQSLTEYNPSGVYVTIAISAVFCLALLFLAMKKLKHLRGCQKSSSKSSPIEDVEEVEPYASYVQRVNSIYNSSRDFFT